MSISASKSILAAGLPRKIENSLRIEPHFTSSVRKATDLFRSALNPISALWLALVKTREVTQSRRVNDLVKFSVTAATLQNIYCKGACSVNVILVGRGLDKVESIRLYNSKSTVAGRILQKGAHALAFSCPVGYLCQETWQVVASGEGQSAAYPFELKI